MTRFSRLCRDGITTFALLALIGLFALKMNNPPETLQSGSFYAVDGDTLKRGGERLRLVGIDAPEYEQQCERDGADWPCGREARSLLVKLLATGPVECRGGDRDRYGRLLVTCRAGGTDINGEMVRRGMAVSYGGYAPLEAQARQAGAGLWAGHFERPQDFRRDEAQERRDPLAGAGDFLKRLAGWWR